MRKFKTLILLTLTSFLLQGCLIGELWKVIKRTWASRNLVVNVPYKDKNDRHYRTRNLARKNWEEGNYVINKMSQEYSGNIQLIESNYFKNEKDVRYFYQRVSRKYKVSQRKQYLAQVAGLTGSNLIFFGEYEKDEEETEITVSLYSKRDKAVKKRSTYVESTSREEIGEAMSMELRDIIESYTK